MNQIEGFLKKSTATALSALMLTSMLAVGGTATASAADTDKVVSEATATWSDGSVLTGVEGLTVNAGDLVNVWVEVTIPEADNVVEAWATDVYYDTDVFKVNTAFADGNMFALGDEAIDYALGLTDTVADLPGGGEMAQGNFETDGIVSFADLCIGGFEYEGNTTKQLCIQLIAKSSGVGDIGYAVKDLVNEDLATVYVDQTTYQATDGASFELQSEILEGQAPTEAPTIAPTEAPTTAPVSQNTMYFVPTTNWTKDSARFSAYYFSGDSDPVWVSLTATSDGKYAGTIPSGNYKEVIFVRMNPDTTANTWDNKWNQTADLTIDGNCFTLTSTDWDNGTGTWSTISDDVILPTEAPTTAPVSQNTMYFVPTTNWTKDSARFSAYYFSGDSDPVWVSLTATSDGKYAGTIPSGNYKEVIFVRMNPDTTANTWDNKWNQTADLTIDGNCFTLTSSEWDNGTGTWSTIEIPTVAPTEAPTVAPTAAPTEAPTEAPTAAPTEAPTTVVTDGYSVTGDFNLKLTACGTNKVSGKIALQPGSYQLKLNNNGTLMGYGKTVTDSSNGMTFKASYSSFMTLNATGGTYTFQVNVATNTLVIKYDTYLPTHYLTGDINTILSPVSGRTLAIGTTYLEAGTYSFKLSIDAVAFGYGKTITDSTTSSMSFKSTYSSSVTFIATGGNYTFTLNTSTNKLLINHSPVKDEAIDDVHLSGDVNLVLDDNGGSSDVATGTVALTEGTYSFKLYNYGQALTAGVKVTDEGTKTLYGNYTTPLTLIATGGTYTFSFDKTTNELTIEKA